MTVRLFGLTGGIGSGKSTVARRLMERGLPVIDADELAREAVRPGSSGLAEIVERFGQDVLDPSGALDRKKLASRVFGNDEARRLLNAITHPRVAALFAERTAHLEARGVSLACYDVPLLFESGLDAVLRPIIVVSAPVEAQIERAARRDGVSADDVRARVRAQLALDEKVRRADFVIDNSGTLGELVARTDSIFDAVCSSLGVDVARYPRPPAPGAP